jgi:hypothetical protein
MLFIQAGYTEGAMGEVKTYTKAYSRERTLVWYGKTDDEKVEVRAEVYPGGETVVCITKDGRQFHPNRPSHLYKSEARAFMAVKATVEWLGYTI